MKWSDDPYFMLDGLFFAACALGALVLTLVALFGRGA